MSWSSPIDHATTAALNAPITITMNSTGADFAVVGVVFYIGFAGSNVITISDNKGNTWHSRPYTTGDGYTQIWYTQGGTFGSSHQITASLSAGSNPVGIGLAGACFSGSKGSPFDAESGQASIFAQTSWQPGIGITPSQAGELYICALGLAAVSGGFGGQAAPPVSIDSGFAITDADVGTANYFGISLAWYINPGTMLINPTWGWTGSAPPSSPMAAFLIPVEGASGVLAFGPPTIGGDALFLTPTGPGVLAFGPIGMSSSAALDEGLPLGRLRQFWTI